MNSSNRMTEYKQTFYRKHTVSQSYYFTLCNLKKEKTTGLKVPTRVHDNIKIKRLFTHAKTLSALMTVV